jgi:magnesium-transporting ATPase (P-type)
MSEELIDHLDSLKKEQPKSHLIKILVFTLIFFSLFLNVVVGNVVHLWIVQFYEFRNKFYNLISVNLVVSALTISIIPFIAYRIWMKVPNFKTWKSYFFLLLSAIILFVGVFVLGLELILQTAVDYQKKNPLLPSYILIPRLPFSFDLLFILSAVMSFLMLKLIFRKSNRKKTI